MQIRKALEQLLSERERFEISQRLKVFMCLISAATLHSHTVKTHTDPVVSCSQTFEFIAVESRLRTERLTAELSKRQVQFSCGHSRRVTERWISAKNSRK